MRKKTAVHATKRQAGSPSKKSGLIAKEKNAEQSATTESVLDNRSHRTTLRISCVRSLTVIANAGHCPHDEAPHQVKPVLPRPVNSGENHQAT